MSIKFDFRTKLLVIVLTMSLVAVLTSDILIYTLLGTLSVYLIILVFKEGQIAERGTHEELVALNGIYSSMWKDYQTSIAWKVGKEDEQHD